MCIRDRGCWDLHGRLSASTAGERHTHARIAGNHPVLDGSPQDRADVLGPRVNRANREILDDHPLHPHLDVGLPDLRQRDVAEGYGARCEIHRTPSAWHPHLTLPPVLVERREGDPACLRVDIRPDHDRCCDLVQPCFRVDLAAEVFRVLLAGLVVVPGTPDAVRSLLNVRHGWAPCHHARCALYVPVPGPAHSSPDGGPPISPGEPRRALAWPAVRQPRRECSYLRRNTSLRHSRSLAEDSCGGGSVALALQPGGDFVVPVAHAAADAEAAGTGAEVAPVTQGGDGDADDVGDFTDGEQFIVAPALRDTLVVLVVLVVHGLAPWGFALPVSGKALSTFPKHCLSPWRSTW